MKYLLAILLSLMWSTYALATTDIDPLYIAMIHEFEEDMVWEVSSSVVIASIKQPKILGFCAIQAKSIWLRTNTTHLPYIIRKALIYHELGHCELGLKHTRIGDGTLTDPFIHVNHPLYYEIYWPVLVADMRMKYLTSLP